MCDQPHIAAAAEHGSVDPEHQVCFIVEEGFM